MQRTTHARNTIGPLLDQLIQQLHAEGSATQCAYFTRIRRSLHHARHDIDLATSILGLSASTAVGFRFSTDADVLIARIVQKAEQLAQELEYPGPTVH